MNKLDETFGSFIKDKRKNNKNHFTLKQMSKILNINLTQLSDIENNRRRPFDKDRIEKFCKVLNLSDEERAYIYDLQARDSNSIPADIFDTIMYTEEGDYARAALRMVNQGKGHLELWKELIRKMEEENC